MARITMEQSGIIVPTVPKMTEADKLFALGMASATPGELDLVTAHKWFNLAALKGSKEALQYRQEIAREMTREEVATAQKNAREWLRSE